MEPRCRLLEPWFTPGVNADAQCPWRDAEVAAKQPPQHRPADGELLAAQWRHAAAATQFGIIEQAFISRGMAKVRVPQVNLVLKRRCAGRFR